jgi:uncharacterized protein (DUF302 family)
MHRNESRDSDPALSPERLGERSVTLRMDHEAALAHVRDVFGEVGFSFPTEFSPAKRIGEERDADPDPYTVVGLGVPAAGEHALEAGGKRVGALFPCSVVVWEAEPGVQEVYHLSVMQIAQAVGIAPDDERWGALVAQVQSMIDDAFADLGRDVAGRHRGIDG